MKILAIDCATEHCSAALWLNGTLFERSAPPARGVSEHLLQWVAELLAEGGTRLHALDLIAFGRGPGAFTGVRFATSLAQGLALSARLSVSPVSTLRAIALQALELAPQAAEVLVCQDARMNEVYWARFARQREGALLLGAERLSAPEAVEISAGLRQVAAGSGFGAYPPLAQAWQARHASGDFVQPLDCAPRARDIARLAELDGLALAVSPELALPVYLRDNIASPPAAQAL
jgi:tRNA threonylcarbamoyladenosine biosynthesis protein TsaB